MYRKTLTKFAMTMAGCLISAAAALSVPAQAAPNDGRLLSGLTDEYVPQTVLPQRRITPLSVLQSDAGNESFHLDGLHNRINFNFAMRADEILTSADLQLHYTPSPALIPIRSQLNIYINGQLQSSLPIEEQDLGKMVKKNIRFDALQLKDQNTMTLEFIGHYMDICEDPSNSTLWLTLDNNSTLNLNSQKIRVADELSFFPAPFLDTNIPDFTDLPLVFPLSPDNAFLKAGAVFSSYCGARTDWRGINFPVYLNDLPSEVHFVVFADNTHRPDFLRSLPQFTGPTLLMRTAPMSHFAKMLIIGGRDSNEVVQAAQALVMGNQLLTGDSSVINKVEELQQRKPYDAPNFVDTSEPITFASLVQYPGQLTTRGYKPYPINLRMRLPPDLFIFSKDTVTLKLNFRYTKPDPATMSQLRFLSNFTLVDTYELVPEVTTGNLVKRLPFIGSMFNLYDYQAQIPGLELKYDNTLTFDFYYGLTYVGGNPENCRLNLPLVHQAEIEGNSTIDLTGFHHYARMPNLGLFARASYPYCIMADLQNTAVIIDDNADSALLTTLFNTMGRIGANVGYPALKVEIMQSSDASAHKDKDFLIISRGNLDRLQSDKLQGMIDGQSRRLTSPMSYKPNTLRTIEQRAGAVETSLESNGPMAMLLGFQSPFDSEKSVVAMLCNSGEGCNLLNHELATPTGLADVEGSAAVIRTSGVQSYDVGKSYYVGHLPFYEKIWYALSNHTLLIVVCTLLCTVLLAAFLYYLFKRIAKRRNGGN